MRESPARARAASVELAGGALVADDVALDEGHHVEGRPVDRLVGAQAEGPGHRDAGAARGR